MTTISYRCGTCDLLLVIVDAATQTTQLARDVTAYFPETHKAGDPVEFVCPCGGRVTVPGRFFPMPRPTHQ